MYSQTTAASTSTNKNYKASQTSSSKQTQPQQSQQHLPSNYRSSMSSHSDIFMKADEQKINFGNFLGMLVGRSILIFFEFLQIFPIWDACHHYTQHRQFHQEVIMREILKINLLSRAPYLPHKMLKAMITLPVTLICALFWATAKKAPKLQSMYQQSNIIEDLILIQFSHF